MPLPLSIISRASKSGGRLALASFNGISQINKAISSRFIALRLRSGPLISLSEMVKKLFFPTVSPLPRVIGHVPLCAGLWFPWGEGAAYLPLLRRTCRGEALHSWRGGVCCFRALFTVAQRREAGGVRWGGLHNYQTVHYSRGSCMVQKYYS